MPVAGTAAVSDGLIAYYPLRTNAEDRLGKNGKFINPMTFSNGVLYVDGQYSYPPSAPGIGGPPVFRGTPVFDTLNYNSFTIALDFYPLRQRRAKPRKSLNGVEQALDSITRGYYRQWSAQDDPGRCNILTGGESYRWIGFNRTGNLLNLTLNNQRFKHRFEGVPVKPHRWHHIICSVDITKRQILTWLDEKQLETVKLPEDFKFEVIGSPSDARERAFTFANFSNGSVFYGYAAELQIFGRALTDAELATASAAALEQMPAFPAPASAWPMFLL